MLVYTTLLVAYGQFMSRILDRNIFPYKLFICFIYINL